MSLLPSYADTLDAYPLPAKMVTVAVISVLSAVLASFVTCRDLSDLDIRLLFAVCIFTITVNAPLFHSLYDALERKCPTARRRNVIHQSAFLAFLFGGRSWNLTNAALVHVGLFSPI